MIFLIVVIYILCTKIVTKMHQFGFDCYFKGASLTLINWEVTQFYLSNII